MMKKLLSATFLSLFLFSTLATAEEWTGWISDAKCGAKGAKAEHKNCAESCVKGGAKPVFVAEGKVYQLADASTVTEYVGQKVAVTGSMDGETIKVESVKAAE